jgi:macrolide-specific efflux system membrane fusion protein
MQVLRALKTWQIVVLVVLIAGIAGGGYGIYKSIAGPATTTTSNNTRLVQVSYGNISNSVSASGNLVFSNETDLSFSSSGTVSYVTVKVGDTVKKGQVIAGIDSSSLQSAVEEAQNNLLSAQYSLQEAEANGSYSDIRQKGTQVTSAALALNKAQDALNGAKLTVPSDGVVITVNIAVGDSSGTGTAIVIVDPSAMEVNAVVSESDVPQVEIGQQATVSVDALPDIEFTGTVTSLALTGQSSSGVVSYPVVIQIPLPSGVQPRGGMSATATIITEQATNVLIVPNRAITGASTDNPTVTVVTNNVSATRAVTIGLVGDSYTEITSGLSYGETVSYTISTTSSSSSSSSSGSFSGGGMMPGGGMFP